MFQPISWRVQGEKGCFFWGFFSFFDGMSCANDDVDPSVPDEVHEVVDEVGGGEAGQGKDRHILPHCGPMVKRALQTVCMYTMRQDRTKILMFSLIVTLWSHVPCKPFV